MARKRLSQTCYTYSDSVDGVKRLGCFLASCNTFSPEYEVHVAQDFHGNRDVRREYERMCAKYGANLTSSDIHLHMCGCNALAVELADTDWVLVSSDDVFNARGLVQALDRFITDNEGSEFLDRVAGAYIHHWDNPDLVQMSRDGMIPEMPDYKPSDFFVGEGEWFIKHLDGRLPYPEWSEPTPPDRIGIVSNVHGSSFLIQRKWWDAVGGCGGIEAWTNDTVYSLRIGLRTNAFFIRLPWLPSIPHAGGASPCPVDPTGKWTKTIYNIVAEHGGQLRDEVRADLDSPTPQSALIHYERALKLRAMSLQSLFRKEIDSLNYSYREMVQ